MDIVNIKQILQLNSKIAIIGAGASGILTSIILASKNYDVTVYEQNSKVGKKLLTTGNGRCNITNQNISLDNFHSDNIDFVKNTLNKFNYNQCKTFFNNIGIEFICQQKNRVYPMSLQASSVVDSLEYEAKRYGVKFILNTSIKDIKYQNQNYIINENSYSKVIIATGSLAMPKLGGNDSGYKFAQLFGHNIIEPFASLVQLQSCNKNLEMISGVKIEGIVNDHFGDILFTKYGISGSAILDISRDISNKLQYQKSVKVSIDTMPNFSRNKLVDMLNKRATKYNDREIVIWLDGFINKKLAKYIILNSNINNNIKYVKFLGKKDILKIVHTIKNLEFEITNTKGFETCEVCAGGIDTMQINPKTMESKLQKNLYFIGEVLDVDGDCGGYNLHWAWTSGYIVATNIIQN